MKLFCCFFCFLCMIRKYVSKFTGKLLKNGIEVDTFSCVEEFTDARFFIISHHLTDKYSFIFDFDVDKKEYKMDYLGRWSFSLPEVENPLLDMNMAIRNYQLDNTNNYKQYY